MTTRTDWIVALAAAACGCLVVMVGITAISGVSQETFEIVRAPAIYAAELRAYAAPLRALFGVDTVFAVLYTTLLISFARRLITDDNRLLIAVAIGATLATGALDMVEDHHILAMLRGAQAGIEPSAAQIAL